MAGYPLLSRRNALLLLGAAVLAPGAIAAPAVSWPFRIAYARVNPGGFVHIRADEQAYWTGLATRQAGLIDTLTPLQPGDMLGGGLPDITEAPSCAMAARQMAQKAGFGHVILYATQDGQRHYERNDNWFSETFSNLRGNFDKGGRATGEAHLLDIHGGPPLASAHTDAAPRDPLNLLDGARNPERETLAGLVRGLEQHLTHLARRAYENERSIAD